MPCRDEERHVERCLRSVLAQDYPPDRLEVLVADGRSTDATRAIVERIAAEDPRVVLVDNPGRLQAEGMNEAIRRARGEVIVRMDVHCEYVPDYVRRCVEVLWRTGADNVGGAQRARAETRFQRALCAALRSPLGMGGARYRRPDVEGWVDTVFLGAFRRDVFERVGMYDGGAITNEDAELNQRIIAAGGRVYLSREIVVHYTPRDSFGRLARQYYRYGRGRARTVLKHRAIISLRPVAPFLLVTGLGVLALVPPLWPALAPVLAAYAAATAAEAVRVARGLGLAAAATAWAIFPVLHASHGAGFAAGLLRYLRNPDWREPERLAAGAPSGRGRISSVA